MFRRRRAAEVQAQREEQAAGREAPESIQGSASPDSVTDREEARARKKRTLDTMCSCGHTRRDHMGLRIEVDGRCLECGCEAFTAAREGDNGSEEMIERMQAAIAQVERIRQLAEGLLVTHDPVNGSRRWRGSR
jgi:hypothetical protein